MKKQILFIVLLCCASSLSAQNPLSREVQTEFGLGISLPSLHGGEELMRSEALREQGLSYFDPPQGERKQVGSYGRLIGWSLTGAYYRPLPKIDGLMMGLVFRLSLTGSQPADGGYEEGYFFNFTSVGLGAKYYPFSDKNVFLKADVGLASVLTKNRFLNADLDQNYFHQFGIGVNTSAGVGYSLTPFRNKNKSLDLQAVYQYYNVRVEVNSIGNDNWRFSALNMMLSMNF